MFDGFTADPVEAVDYIDHHIVNYAFARERSLPLLNPRITSVRVFVKCARYFLNVARGLLLSFLKLSLLSNNEQRALSNNRFLP